MVKFVCHKVIHCVSKKLSHYGRLLFRSSPHTDALEFGANATLENKHFKSIRGKRHP